MFQARAMKAKRRPGFIDLTQEGADSLTPDDFDPFPDDPPHGLRMVDLDEHASTTTQEPDADTIERIKRLELD